MEKLVIDLANGEERQETMPPEEEAAVQAVADAVAQSAAQAAAQEANARSIQDALAAQLADLQAIIDTPNATLNSSPAVAIKALARGQRRLIRLATRQLDATS